MAIANNKTDQTLEAGDHAPHHNALATAANSAKTRLDGHDDRLDAVEKTNSSQGAKLSDLGSRVTDIEKNPPRGPQGQRGKPGGDGKPGAPGADGKIAHLENASGTDVSAGTIKFGSGLRATKADDTTTVTATTQYPDSGAIGDVLSLGPAAKEGDDPVPVWLQLAEPVQELPSDGAIGDVLSLGPGEHDGDDPVPVWLKLASGGGSGGGGFDFISATHHVGKYVMYPDPTLRHFSTPLTDLMAPAAKTMYLVPLVVTESEVFDRIGVGALFWSGSGGSELRLGLYASKDAGRGVGDRIADFGTVVVTGSTGAFAAVTINQTLTPGVYWLAVLTTADFGSSSIRMYYRNGVSALVVPDASYSGNPFTLGWGGYTYSPTPAIGSESALPTSLDDSQFTAISGQVYIGLRRSA